MVTEILVGKRDGQESRNSKNEGGWVREMREISLCHFSVICWG